MSDFASKKAAGDVRDGIEEALDTITKSGESINANVNIPVGEKGSIQFTTNNIDVLKKLAQKKGEKIGNNENSVKTALPKGHVYLEDYAKGLFGDDYQAHMSGLAKTFGIDNYKEENASNYNIDPRSQKSNKALGEYLNGFDGYNIDYLDQYNTKGTVLGGITTNANKGTTTDAVTRGLDDINNKYIQNGVNLIEENAYSTNANSIYSDIVTKNRNKIDKGSVADFRKMQDTVRGYLDDVTKLANENGYDEAYGEKGSAFVNSYGKNNTMYGRATGRASILDYTVDDEGNVSRISKINNDIDYLAEATGDLDYTDAKNAFAEKFSGTTDDYYKSLKDGDITDSSIKKLIDLKNAGMDIGESGEKILEGYAYTHKAGYGTDKSVVNNLSNAAQQQIKKYDNISDENLTYLKGEGGLQLEYADGKFGISQQSIDLMTDDERNNKYKKLIDSNDVGKENLSEIGGALDRRYRENKVVDEINNQNMNNIINDDKARANYINNLDPVQKADFDSYASSSGWYDGINEKARSEYFDTVDSKVKEEVNRRIGEELQFQQEKSIDNVSEYKASLTDDEIKKIEDSVNAEFKPNIEKEVDESLREKYRPDIEKTYIKNNYVKNNGITSDDIRKGASSNYDRITKSYASEDYDGYSLSNDEVLKRSGVTNENLRGEILGAKKFDDLSPEAMGALYVANSKLSQRDINLGNFKELSEQEIESIEKMNPELGKKLRDISAGDKAQILGRTQEEVSNYLGLDKDGLTSKLEMKRNASLDINDPKVARKVLEDLSNKNPEEALADLIDFTGSRKGYGDFGGGKANKVLDAFRTGTLERDLRSGRLEQAYGIVRDTIDEIKSIHGKDFAKEYDQFDAKTNSMKDKFSVENMKKQAKNFDKADYDRIDAAFDKGLEATAKRVKDLSGPLTKKAGNLGKIGSFLGSGKGKAVLGVAGGMAAIFGVASIAGNAAEERERKRQEMNQLIAAQNANIRSGY